MLLLPLSSQQTSGHLVKLRHISLIMAHFLYSDWNVHVVVLDTFHMTQEHAADNTSKGLLKVAEDWNITIRISVIVTDNAANMEAAVALSKWRHHPCYDHTLNLIFKDATKGSETLKILQLKVSILVSHFRYGVKAMDRSTEVQSQNSIGFNKADPGCQNSMEFHILHVQTYHPCFNNTWSIW